MTLTNSPVVPMLPAVDLNRAKKFYEEKLGLVPADMKAPGTAFYKAGAGTMLGLYERGATKADHTAACFEVTDIEATMADMRAKGVAFEEYDDPGFKTVNGIAVADGKKCAWFKDTEGNILGLNEA